MKCCHEKLPKDKEISDAEFFQNLKEAIGEFCSTDPREPCQSNELNIEALVRKHVDAYLEELGIK